MTNISCDIEHTISNKLAFYAQKQERSKSALMRIAICKYIEELEEEESLKLAYDDYIKSGQKTISFENIMKANGL